MTDIVTQIDDVIATLQKSRELCAKVDYDSEAKGEQRPPYIIGWNYSALQIAINDLKTVKKLCQLENRPPNHQTA